MAQKSDTELQTYLDELAQHGNSTKAARAAGMTLRTVIQYREADPDFVQAESIALQEAGDMLEGIAFDLVVNGRQKQHFDKNGNHTGTSTTYNDAVLLRLLEGAKPEKYARRVKSEMSGPEGKPISIEDSTNTAARIATLLFEAKERRALDSDPLFGEDA